MATPSRMQCKREIDATICKLERKKKRLVRADSRRMAVRNYMNLKPTAKKYLYACVREEGTMGRRGGGQDVLIQHDGNFKKLLHHFASVYDRGGHVQSVHFSDDWKTTTCGYWTLRQQRKEREARR